MMPDAQSQMDLAKCAAEALVVFRKESGFLLFDVYLTKERIKIGIVLNVGSSPGHCFQYDPINVLVRKEVHMTHSIQHQEIEKRLGRESPCRISFGLEQAKKIEQRV